jgi:hypothetical protein
MIEIWIGDMFAEQHVKDHRADPAHRAIWRIAAR